MMLEIHTQFGWQEVGKYSVAVVGGMLGWDVQLVQTSWGGCDGVEVDDEVVGGVGGIHEIDEIDGIDGIEAGEG